MNGSSQKHRVIIDDDPDLPDLDTLLEPAQDSGPGARVLLQTFNPPSATNMFSLSFNH